MARSAQAADLATALRKRLRGEVRFDPGSRALYATDLSIYRQPPIGVVIPRTIEDVIIAVAECRHRAIPILGRGCGTSLAGQTCNIAVVIDFSKYLNRLLTLDPLIGEVGRADDAADDPKNETGDEDRPENRDARKRVRAAVEDLRHSRLRPVLA